MNKKVIATDLDGTLLHYKKWISKTNIHYLEKFIKDGGIVNFITGRSLESTIAIADKFYQKTKCQISYLACLNGSIIYDYKNKQIIEQTYIDPTFVQNIFDYIKKVNKYKYTQYFQYDSNHRYINAYGFSFIVKLVNFFKKNSLYKNINDNNFNMSLNSTYKINIIKTLHSFDDVINKLKLLDINFTYTSNHLIEITHKNINKEYAIKKISNLLNISLNNFTIFGDSPNDIPMLSQSPNAYITRCKYLDKNKFHYDSNFKQKNAVGNWIKKIFYNC